MSIRVDIFDVACAGKVVNQSNIMRKWNAIGVSESILWSLKSRNVLLLRFVVRGEKTRVFFASVDQFLFSCKVHDFFEGDKQFFVSLDDMLLRDRLVQRRLEVVS